MAVYNRRFNYLFLCEPHTASRAVSQALLRDSRSENIGHHHIGLKEIVQKRLLSPKQIDQATTFSVIRCPYDWLVSAWFNFNQKSSFEELVYGFLKTGQQKTPLGRSLFWRSAGVRTNLIYHTLQKDLHNLLDSIKSPRYYLPKVGVTEDKGHWWSYYDEALLNYVNENSHDVRLGFQRKWVGPGVKPQLV